MPSRTSVRVVVLVPVRVVACVADGEQVAVGESVGLCEGVAEGLALGEGPGVFEGVCVETGVMVAVRVADAVRTLVAVGVEVGVVVAYGVDDGVGVMVVLLLGVWVSDNEGEAEGRPVGECESVPVREAQAVHDGVCVCEGVIVGMGDEVVVQLVEVLRLGVCVCEGVELGDGDRVMDGVILGLQDAVGEHVADNTCVLVDVAEGVGVVEGVEEGVVVAYGVDDGVGVMVVLLLGVWVSDNEGEAEGRPVGECESVPVREAQAVHDGVCVCEGVVVGVGDEVVVQPVEVLRLGVCVCEGVELGDGDRVMDGVILGLQDAVGEHVADNTCVLVDVAEGVGVVEGVEEGVVVVVKVGVPVCAEGKGNQGIHSHQDYAHAEYESSMLTHSLQPPEVIITTENSAFRQHCNTSTRAGRFNRTQTVSETENITSRLTPVRHTITVSSCQSDISNQCRIKRPCITCMAKIPLGGKGGQKGSVLTRYLWANVLDSCFEALSGTSPRLERLQSTPGIAALPTKSTPGGLLVRAAGAAGQE